MRASTVYTMNEIKKEERHDGLEESNREKSIGESKVSFQGDTYIENPAEAIMRRRSSIMIELG